MPRFAGAAAPLSRRKRASEFFALDRANGFRRVSAGLFQTHTFAPGTTGIDVSDSFGTDAQRERPITFEFGLTRSSASPTGDVIQLGTAGVREFKVTLSTDDLTIIAGGTGANQASKTVQACTPALNKRFTIAIGIYPNRGSVTVWRDGVKIDSFAAAAGTFAGAWASDSSAGSYGSALTGATVGRLAVFNNQFPFRQRI